MKTLALCTLYATTILISMATQAEPQAPGEIRIEDISVGAATSAEGNLESYTNILQLAGRVVTNIRITSQNGFGHILELKFTTTGSRPVNCKWEKQTVSINYLQNLETEVKRVLALEQIDSSRIIDVEKSGTFGTGRISAVDIYYCN